MTISEPAPRLTDKAGRPLHEKLRIARLMADLEQAELARMIGVSRNTISAWENGRNEPSATGLVRIARITGQSLDWFAEGVNDVTPAEAGAWVRHEGFEPPTF